MATSYSEGGTTPVMVPGTRAELGRVEPVPCSGNEATGHGLVVIVAPEF